MHMLPIEIMAAIFDRAAEEDLELYVDPLNVACEEFEITSIKRLAAFCAQIGHESMHLRVVEENLNYSAEGLMRIFPKYFRDVDPGSYARKPQKIANRVYANRMGNGPPESGDGWKYRGRGLIQLTGKHNYSECAEGLDIDIVEDPDYLLTPEGACRSAGWFWYTRGINQIADKGDIVAVSIKVNGGTIGLKERIAIYNRAIKVLKQSGADRG
jgi:putative chitinase